MKTLLTILTISIFQNVFATDYYFSAAGNNSNAGTSSGAPWQTLSKLTSVTLGGDDHIYLRGGDTFVGGITIGQSGSSGHPITFTSYGTGKATITGFTTVSGWTSLGSGIYESTSTVSALSTMNVVTLDGVDVAQGRYPKTGYLTYQSGTNGTITSNAISAYPSFVGGEVYVRFNRWSADKGVITNQSSTVVTYTPQSGFTPTANYGFFFTNHANTLTQVGTTLGEWYYSPSSFKVRMYFGSESPSSHTIKVSSSDKLVTISNKSYITFDNLSFQGGNTNAFYITTGTGDIVQNCDILFTGKNAIEAASTSSLTVSGNYIDYSHTSGVEAGFQTTGATITNNNIRHSGMTAAMAWKKSNDDIFAAIRCHTAGSTISGNTVFAAGFMGIRAHVSNNTTVQNNYVDSTCFIKDDGGGIYTWASGSTTHSNFQILGNVVLNSIGATAGTSSSTPEGEGIYIDDNSDHVTVQGNTVSNARRGIFLHNVNNVTIRNNTVFNCQYAFRTTMDIAGTNVSLNIKSNIFFALDAAQYTAYFKSTASSLNLGTLDSNYYCRPLVEGASLATDLAGVTTQRSLSNWQSYSSQDANSNVTAVQTTDQSKIRFDYNTTGSSIDIPLSADYTGVDGTAYSGSVTLPAYSSLILIQTAGGSTDTCCPINKKKKKVPITLLYNENFYYKYTASALR